jgi:hypothetical protein
VAPSRTSRLGQIGCDGFACRRGLEIALKQVLAACLENNLISRKKKMDDGVGVGAWREHKTKTSGGASRWPWYLVIQIRYVHDILHVVLKIVSEHAADNIERNVSAVAVKCDGKGWGPEN